MREHNNLPATFNDRINAFFLDLGIVALAVLINIFMQIDFITQMIVNTLIWFLINIVPSFFYNGQTVGKKSAKIKVVKIDNSEVSQLTYIIRSLFIFIVGFATIGLYFFIGLYVSEKRVDKRSIHDLLFKTKVIRTTVFVSLSE